MKTLDEIIAEHELMKDKSLPLINLIREILIDVLKENENREPVSCSHWGMH